MSNSMTSEAAAAAGSVDRAMGRFKLSGGSSAAAPATRAQAVSLPLVGEVPTLAAVGGGVALLLVLVLALGGGGGEDGAPRVNIN